MLWEPPLAAILSVLVPQQAETAPPFGGGQSPFWQKGCDPGWAGVASHTRRGAGFMVTELNPFAAKGGSHNFRSGKLQSGQTQRIIGTPTSNTIISSGRPIRQ